jgi:hypothetical protein
LEFGVCGRDAFAAFDEGRNSTGCKQLIKHRSYIPLRSLRELCALCDTKKGYSQVLRMPAKKTQKNNTIKRIS